MTERHTETFRTLESFGEAHLSVRGSTFIGYAQPAASVAAAEGLRESVAAAHPDATHLVPAYRVRADPLREYATDDGEPAGSAGKPILRVLQGERLENAAVVVARSYGGVDLGTGGLARAYAEVAGAAITAADVVETVPHTTVTVTVDYDDSGTVRTILESESVRFEATYEEQVTFEVQVAKTGAEALRDRLRSATSGRVELA